jgi:competence ComEA-like helix-hairpin-helix protein
MWAFAPAEKRAILFLVITLIVGSGVLSYRKYNPDFAPELLRGSSDSKRLNWYNNPAPNFTVNEEIKKVSSNPAITPPLGQLNLNTATREDLEKLPLIGPVLAKKIIDYRYEKGGFSRVEELLEVKGIGKKNFAVIKDYLILE